MSIAKPIAIAGVLATVIATTPGGVLQAQVKPGQDSAARRTWGVNPGPVGAWVGRRTDALADTAFIREATSGNLLEVRLGQLAGSRAADSAVREFASRMVADHGSMQKQWIDLGKSTAVPVDIRLSPAQEREVTRLENLSGAGFDREYMATMIRDHEQDGSTFQRMEPSLRSSDVRRLAASGLATIQEHLAMARQVASRVGTSPVAAVAPTRENREVQDRDRERNGGVQAEGDFIRQVMADHVMEIRLGEQARRKASDADTRRFAERMVADFGNWRDRWSGLASRNDVSVSSGLGKFHQQRVDSLEKMSKKGYDRRYAALVAANLNYILTYFQDEGRSGRSAAVRRLVDDELPLVRERLAQARRLAGESSERADAARRTR